MKVSRRKFVKGSAAALGSGLIGCTHLERRPSSVELEMNEFDFVVVGSGAGGGIVASRLAEYGYSVAVIEAGVDHLNSRGEVDDTIEVPAYHALSSEDPRWSWEFSVKHFKNQEPSERYLPTFKGGVYYPRASAFGGCTIHNAMISMAPPALDFPNSLLPKTIETTLHPRVDVGFKESVINPQIQQVWEAYFKRVDSYLGIGKAPISNLFENDKLLATFLSAAKQNGQWKTLGQVFGQGFDPNHWKSLKQSNKSISGLARIPMSVENGKRKSVRERMLEAKQGGAKISFFTSHIVSELIVESGRRGVEVKGVIAHDTRGEQVYKAAPNSKPFFQNPRKFVARKEVILAGGAFNTPQLLKLNGIGPRGELSQWGIPVRIDSPHVGRNLLDRYEMTVVSQIKNNFHFLESCSFDPAQDPCLDEYKRSTHRPHFYSTNGIVCGMFVGDVFLFAFPGDFRGYFKGYSRKVLNHKDRLTWAILKAHTYDRNRSSYVNLTSNNFLDTPEVFFDSFSDTQAKTLRPSVGWKILPDSFKKHAKVWNSGESYDLEDLWSGVYLAREIMGKDSNVVSEVWPGPKYQYEGLEKFTKENAWGHHACGTCRMGQSISDGVIDHEFKVFGAENLRVVDASVFKQMPGYFIAVPIMMMAERAADLIHSHWLKKSNT